MGLLLAVNRGSMRDPAFILVEYRGNPGSSDVTALVGKGITFDTGGLNLKPTGSMETMKDDMSGAAAVLGAIRAAAALKLKVNILGAIPTTENSIGSKAYKPGDVYRSYSGKTVEIANTDAEGRLVLADALAYVQKHYKPSRIVDFATLTGAVVIALGEEASALFCNDEGFAAKLMDAGSRSAERLWRMPLYPEYKELMKSTIADLKNSGGRAGGLCTSAAFLSYFVKDVPWAHLDIAGTAFLSSPKHYHTTNATGVGVRMLVEFFLAHETNV
jgi:leucyl aminopeptidase